MNAQDYYFRDTCRLCESKDLTKVIELTPTPPGNNFLTEAELGQPEPTYPLELYFCVDCFHLQLGHVVDPEILYQNNYHYVSGTSSVFVEHLRTYAAHMISKFSLPKGSLIGDIGSNDGTCLRAFKDAGFEVLGVDPATEIADQASKDGIPTVNAFFNSTVAAQLREQHGAAKLVTSHNACAHIDDLKDVVVGARDWLADDGLFCIEVGYLVDVYQNTWFDTMYHEHLDYHSVAPLVKFFTGLKMSVVSVERIAPQGGSIRVIVQKEGGPYGFGRFGTGADRARGDARPERRRRIHGVQRSDQSCETRPVRARAQAESRRSYHRGLTVRRRNPRPCSHTSTSVTSSTSSATTIR